MKDTKPEWQRNGQWHLDCSRRVQKALTRNAAPIHETYRPGDLVVYRRDEQVGGTKWSSAARVIGQESSESIWVIHNGLPVLCSAHALRPANEEEVLAHCLVNGIPVLPSEITEGKKTKRGYVDRREPDPEEARPKEPEEKRARSEKRAPKRKQEAPSSNIPAQDVPIPEDDESSSSSSPSSDEEEERPIDKTGDRSQGSVRDNDPEEGLMAVGQCSIADSEAAAQAALENGDFRIATCLNLLRSAPLKSPSNRSAAGGGEIHAFGAAHGTFSGLTGTTDRHICLVRCLNSFARERGATKGWCSFTVNYDVEAPPHRDNHNLTDSWNQVIALGPFEGGQIWLKDDHPKAGSPQLMLDGKNGKVLSCRNRFVIFDPKTEHATAPLRGAMDPSILCK